MKAIPLQVVQIPSNPLTWFTGAPRKAHHIDADVGPGKGCHLWLIGDKVLVQNPRTGKSDVFSAALCHVCPKEYLEPEDLGASNGKVPASKSPKQQRVPKQLGRSVQKEEPGEE